MAATYNETYESLNKRVYSLIKRFERENCVLVNEVTYNGDWDGDRGEENSKVTSVISFMWNEEIKSK